MRVVFMGTPEFAVPALRALAAVHDVVCVYTQPPRPAGRGKRERPTPVQARGEELGLPVRHPASLRGAEVQADFAALRRRCGSGGGLWPDPAARDPRCAGAWLPEHPRLAVAALARGSADPPGDPGGRWRDRSLHHADGGGAGYRAGAAARGDAHRPRGDDGRSSRQAFRHGGRADRGGRREDRRLVPVPQSERGVTYAAKITRTRRG